jgi:hypothetical protein
MNYAPGKRKYIAMKPTPSNKITFSGLDVMTPNRLKAAHLADFPGEEEHPIGNGKAQNLYHGQAGIEAQWARHRQFELINTNHWKENQSPM